MKLTTIWTMPGMPLRERWDRTTEWAAMESAAHLPKRIKYWAFVLAGAKVTTSSQLNTTPVPDLLFMDVLEHVEGGPRR